MKGWKDWDPGVRLWLFLPVRLGLAGLGFFAGFTCIATLYEHGALWTLVVIGVLWVKWDWWAGEREK